MLEKKTASQVALVVKNPPASSGDVKRRGLDYWVGKVPWRRKWQPAPVVTGESHGERSLVGCGPQRRRVGRDGSDLAHTA